VAKTQKRRKRAKSAGWRRVGKAGKPQARRRKRIPKPPIQTNGDGAKLLAIDFSSSCTGWAYFESGRLRSSGKNRMDGKSHSEKLAGFLDWAVKLFSDLKPSEVALEKPFQGRHANAYGVLSMYKAVLMLAHWKVFGRPFPEENQLPAHVIKKALGVPKSKEKTTDKRHTDNKRAVIKVINGLYGTAFKFSEDKRSEDDIADAVAVGHVWYALHVDNQDPEVE
jgi:Holliday junction resolvasome RuvABC endonuclease subunit